MKWLRSNEEFNGSENYDERVQYLEGVIEDLKDICLPLSDRGIEITIPESEKATAMVVNILYSDKYIQTYNDFYRSIMGKDLRDLSDLFYLFFRFPTDKIYRQIPDWIFTVLRHINDYMETEGFKCIWSLKGNWDSKSLDYNSLEELMGSGQQFSNLRIGFKKA